MMMTRRERGPATRMPATTTKYTFGIVLWLVVTCKALSPLRPKRISSDAASYFKQRSNSIALASSAAAEATPMETTSPTLPTARPSMAPPSMTPLPKMEDLLGRDGIYSLSNPVDLKVFLYNFPDQIACVRVHAPWCKTCKSMAPHYRKLAKTYAKHVVFADFNARNNQDFCRNILDVEAFPTVLIYKAPNELLSTHPCGPSKVKKVKEALQGYIDSTSSNSKSDEVHDAKAIETSSATTTSDQRIGSQVVSRLQCVWKSLF